MEKLSMREEQIYALVCTAEADPNLSTTMTRANERYNRQWKPQTISTFLTRLVKKKYLTFYRKGRYCYYQPTISLEEYRSMRLRDDVHLLFNGKVEAIEEIVAEIEKSTDVTKIGMDEKTSECEEQVLMIIYGSDTDLALDAIIQATNTKFGHQWKPQTVSTFLTRMVRKGYLIMYRKGRYCYYQPVIEERRYKTEKVLDLLDVLFDGNIACMKEYIERLK